MFGMLRTTCRTLAVISFFLVIVACQSDPIKPTPTKSEPPTETPQVIGEIVSVAGMVERRAAHTATALNDGRVLLTGGFVSGEEALDSAEIYTPSTQSFSSITPMNVGRQSHTATRLNDGTVLIAGGFNNGYLASAEIYDPATDQFTTIAPLTTARSNHVATLLDDGTVLLVGGVGDGWTFLRSAEIYDPTTRTFTKTGDMLTPRESHTATLLQDGTVLVAGGHQGRRAAIEIFDSAEIYDPSTGTFSTTNPLTIRRHKHDATLLADGRVFISGGADERDGDGAYRSTEIYDPATGRFTQSADMHTTRYKHTNTSLLLPSGQVLLVGGSATFELYNPTTDDFRIVKQGAGVTRLFATATIIPDGQALITGGYGKGVSAESTAWLYTP